jgi:hypothetical protein
MFRRSLAILLALTIGAAAPTAAGIRAQEQVPTASKQELARAKFRELTDRMQKLMVVLQKSEPEDSRLIAAGLQFVQEAKIHEDLGSVRALLDQERWDDALVEMVEVRKDLTKLFDLLQNRNVDLQKLMEQSAKLQGFRDRVDQLAKEQAEEKDASARTEELQEHLKNIEAQQQKVAALLAQQKDLRAATNQLGVQAAAEATKPLEQKEGQLQQDADKLAKDLDALERKDEQIRNDAKAAGAKGQPGQAAPPSQGSSGKPSGSAGKAAQSMGQAQKQLGDNRPESSLKDQDQAIESLKKTAEELEAMAEDARRELLKLPFELQAKNQEKTEHATDTLSKDMEKSEQSEDNADGAPTPGRRRVQQAVPKQRAAAGQLKEYKPAKQKQQDAKDDLDAAKKELEDALAQLRQQLQDEVLRALEERFTAMLAKQRELSVQTKTLDATRQNVLTASGAMPAALAERIQVVASGEGDLEVEAADALKLLAEEGTTAVFPEIVQELKDQLHEVARRCRANETDAPVQQRQAEVEDTLALLINALRRTIEQKEGGH